MWVWPGLQLIGGGRTSRKVLNGVCYIAHGFDDEHLRVTTHPDFGAEELIELGMREASENLRLCYAAVYHSCQGRTLKQQHVLLMDVHKHLFTGRHLYVGASRVTSGQCLHVVSREDTACIRQILREAPLESAKETDRVDVQTAEEGIFQFARDRLDDHLTDQMLLEDAVESV